MIQGNKTLFRELKVDVPHKYLLIWRSLLSFSCVWGSGEGLDLSVKFLKHVAGKKLDHILEKITLDYYRSF